MLLSGAWGKVIHEKTWSKKSRDTVPLNWFKIWLSIKNIFISWQNPFQAMGASGTWFGHHLMHAGLHGTSNVFYVAITL